MCVSQSVSLPVHILKSGRRLTSSLFIKGRTDLAVNYRSVSLLPIVSKVFEKLLLDVFVNHIRPVVADAQHGFVSNRSCVTNLGELMAYATTALKEKSQLEII